MTRQIQSLESKIGAALFLRAGRGVSLTPVGQTYYAEISPAFDIIGSATARLGERSAEEPLKIRVYPIFAMQWLIPRLTRLKKWAPTLKLRFDPAVDAVDFERDNVDAAIQFGAGDNPGANAELLIPDEIEPVCAPSLIRGTHPLRTPEDLKGLLLLHSHYRASDWTDWSAFVGHPQIAHKVGMELPSSVLVYEATREGLGVAIGQTSLLRDDLATGRLLRPFRQPLRRPLGYHLLTPHSKEQPTRVRVFRAWLMSMLAAEASRLNASAITESA